MEKDFNSWFQHSCLDLNSSGARPQNNFSAYMIPHYNGISTNGNFPLSSLANKPNEPRNWLNSLPNFHQGFNPLLKSVTKEKDQNLGRIGNPNISAGRKFLVFDQSGDQTRLLYSSANDNPAQGALPWLQKPSTAYNSTKDHLGSRINKTSPLGRFLGDECIEDDNHRGVEESEMREDTEELNALLYSDDDDDGDFSEDEEEMSTGHSPSTMTAHNKPEPFDERIEEVASSDEPTKRRKVFDGSYGAPFGSSELEGDAESSCGNADYYQVLSGRKRSRKEKIRETLSLLQKIIPGGKKGKDAMDVIDGTIRYLKSLKVEAKSLRLD